MTKTNQNLKLHVGGTLAEVTSQVVDDVARFESGRGTHEDHLTFENWQAMFNVLTPKRYELLRHLHRQSEPSLRALARALNRDYKRVYEDVQALMEVGLLQQEADGLHADYAAIEVPPIRIAL